MATGDGTFDLYAPGGPGAPIMNTLTLQFDALMVTDPTTPIHLWGTGFYELASAGNIVDLQIILNSGQYQGGQVVSHPQVHNTAFVTVVPEPSTLTLLAFGLLAGAAVRFQRKS